MKCAASEVQEQAATIQSLGDTVAHRDESIGLHLEEIVCPQKLVEPSQDFLNNRSLANVETQFVSGVRSGETVLWNSSVGSGTANFDVMTFNISSVPSQEGVHNPQARAMHSAPGAVRKLLQGILGNEFQPSTWN